MGELISVVITTHNRSALLKRAIDSVLSQTYDNIECIVVDDNSNDKTKELCSNYNNIKYIYIPKEESRGGNYARNLGIKSSSGAYVAFLDDDDYWLEDKTEKQLLLALQSEAKVIYCGRINEIIINDEEKKFIKSLPRDDFRGDLSNRIFRMIPTTTSALFVERKLLDEVGLFDEKLRFWQEYDLMIRMAQTSIFDFVNEPLLVYRIDKNDKNRLTNHYKPWRKAVKYILKKHHNIISKLNFKDYLRLKLLISNDAYLRLKDTRSSFKHIAKIKYLFYIFLQKVIK